MLDKKKRRKKKDLKKEDKHAAVASATFKNIKIPIHHWNYGYNMQC